jgi:hypothetical protein
MKKCLGCGNETYGEEKVCMLCGCDLKEVKDTSEVQKKYKSGEKSVSDNTGLLIRMISKATEIRESLMVVLMILIAIFSLSIISDGQILLLTEKSSNGTYGAVLNTNSFNIGIINLFYAAMFGSIIALAGSIVSNNGKIFTTISMVLCVVAIMAFIMIPGECSDLLSKGFHPLVSYTENLEHFFGRDFSGCDVSLSASGKIAFGGLIAYGLMHIYTFIKDRLSVKITLPNN